jgi:hypothetical protein
MPPPRLRRLGRWKRRWLGWLAGCALLVSEAAAQVGDPFGAGLVWRHAAEPAAAWLPWSVDLAADGELVWAGGGGSAPRWMLFQAPPTSGSAPLQPPRFQDDATLPSSGALTVAGSRAPERLFSAVRVAAGPGKHRAEVVRHDALHAALGAPFTARWIHDLGFTADGAPRLAASADGSRVACAVHDGGSAQLRVDFLDGHTGALLARRDLAAGTLRRIALGADGRRLALVAGSELWVLDETGATLHHEVLALATHALALSGGGDGAVLCVGAGAALRVLQAGAGGYAPLHTLTAPLGEFAARAAIAVDASTLAVGWWDALDGRSVRLEAYDVPSGVRLFELAQPGAPGAPQNFPEAVCVTPDGRRAAFGLWGAADARPELVVFDRVLARTVLEQDLPGSVLSLAVAPDGKRLALGMKHVHANQFGATGEVRLYSTGESDLVLTDAPRLGRPWRLAASRPGAKAVLFLVGQLAAGPQTLPGATGALWLDRNAPIAVHAAAVDPATGRARLVLHVPAAVGTSVAVQTVARVGASVVLGESVVLPVTL